MHVGAIGPGRMARNLARGWLKVKSIGLKPRLRGSNISLTPTGLLYYVLLMLLPAACSPTLEVASPQQTPPSIVVDLPTPSQPIEPELPASTLPVNVESGPLTAAESLCLNRFIEHQLDHTTTVPAGHEVRMFEANGSGVAVNDLDHDGDLEIVLANHADPNTILWNEGALNFRTERIGEGDSRAVNIVDVDGDQWLDIIFTRRASAPNYWRNEEGRQFTRTVMPGVDKPLYAINWADLDGDNDLDFVGGTYDADLLVVHGNEFLTSDKAGVFVYEQQNNKFSATRLAGQAHALSILLPDLNEDGRLDIMVGNDFARPDDTWVQAVSGWVETPFDTTSHSTMSLDMGDVDNDGSFELFSTDMRPYDDDPEVEAAWQPVMDDMMADPHPPDDPQIMANVLQLQTGLAGYQNTAGPRGIEATGWSWSGKFGDLNQDGWLDLYVINGFMATTTFPHLPDHELVEENQAFQNRGNGYFSAVPEWGLGSTRSGRGMSMADLDNDGDLDVVINNLRGPAQLFENQLCHGNSLQVDLRWPTSGNSRALGAKLILYTEVGSLSRDVRAASGHLSGDPARVHFGFPQNTVLHGLAVYWPDGETSAVTELQADSLVTITRE